MALRLLLVNSGVLWIYGRIFEYALAIDEGISGGLVDGAAILGKSISDAEWQMTRQGTRNQGPYDDDVL